MIFSHLFYHPELVALIQQNYSNQRLSKREGILLLQKTF